jgi:hypothetical protein
VSTEVSALRGELAGLAAMESQMTRDVQTLRERKRSAELSKTLRGRLWQLGGYAFSVYCVYRVFMVSFLSYHCDFYQRLTRFHRRSLTFCSD